MRHQSSKVNCGTHEYKESEGKRQRKSLRNEREQKQKNKRDEHKNWKKLSA